MTTLFDQMADDPFEACTFRAFDAWRARDVRAASADWLAAREMARTLPAFDARRAAAANNAAVAYVLLGQFCEAKLMLSAAEVAWCTSRDWIETCDPQFSGRSSTFHLRLAARNGEAFANLHRLRLRTESDAGLAITSFNTSAMKFLSGDAASHFAGFQTCVGAIAAAFGNSTAEIEIVRAWDPARTAGRVTDSAPARTLPERWRERRLRDGGDRGGDRGGIGAASHLSAILDASLATTIKSDNACLSNQPRTIGKSAPEPRP